MLQAVWRSRTAFVRLLREQPDAAAAIRRRRSSGQHSGLLASHARSSTEVAISPREKQRQRDKNLPISRAHVSKWAAAGRAWDARQRLADDYHDAQVRKARASVDYSRSVHEVESRKALSDVPYWNQGNADFYTESALSERFSLRQHPRVVGMLHQWWAMVLRSIQAGGDPSAAELEKTDYCKLLCRIYKALLKPYNAKDAREAAEEDWEEDAQGRRTMNRELFMEALCACAGLPSAASARERTSRQSCHVFVAAEETTHAAVQVPAGRRVDTVDQRRGVRCLPVDALLEDCHRRAAQLLLVSSPARDGTPLAPRPITPDSLPCVAG